MALSTKEAIIGMFKDVYTEDMLYRLLGYEYKLKWEDELEELKLSEEDRITWLKFCVMWAFISFQMKLDVALSNAFNVASLNVHYTYVEPFALRDVGY